MEEDYAFAAVSAQAIAVRFDVRLQRFRGTDR
jgi:hypothetical protein